MKYLGIDWGAWKIGLATGSDETRVASPFYIMIGKKDNQAIAEIKRVIEEEDIDVLVVGKPLSLSGRENDSVKYTKFVTLLKTIDIKIDFQDERMSTKHANVLERDFGKVKHDRDDDIAATVILQTYIDRVNLDT